MSQRPQTNGISAIHKNARELFFSSPSIYVILHFLNQSTLKMKNDVLTLIYLSIELPNTIAIPNKYVLLDFIADFAHLQL